VAAADAEDGRRRPDGEGREAAKHLRVVVVEVGERPAEDDGLRVELFGRLDHLGEMRDANLGLDDQPLDIVDDVVEREPRDVTLALQLGGGRLAPLAAREFGEVGLVAQQVVDDEDANLVDPLLEGLVRAVGALAVWERERVELLLRVVVCLWRHRAKTLSPLVLHFRCAAGAAGCSG
jgi:hypothetical protein